MIRALGLLGLILVSCATTPPADPLAGTYQGSGGGGALALVDQLTKRFSAEHPGVRWHLENTSSDTGVTLVSSGEVDFGYVSREPTPAERARVSLIPIGATATAIAVNAANSVRALDTATVRRIFTGLVRNWSELGGPDLSITVIIRDPGSSTRDNFEEVIFGSAAPAYPSAHAVAVSGDEMVSDLVALRGAIGYVTVNEKSTGDKRISLLALDGVAPAHAAIAAGRYPMRRPLYLVLASGAPTVKPAIRAFVDFVRSPEGQQLIAAQ